MKKILSTLFGGSIVATYILLTTTEGEVNYLSFCWLAPISLILSCTVNLSVDWLAVQYFGHEETHNQTQAYTKLVYTNLMLTALMVIIMFFVNNNKLGGDIYLFKYMLPWIILLGESIVLAVLTYLSNDYKLKNVYNEECFVIDKVKEEQEVSTEANDIIKTLKDIENRVECSRRLKHKDNHFDYLLETLRRKKYHLTEEEYNIINKMLDNYVDTSPAGMISYLEIKQRLQQYRREANKKPNA